MRQKTTSNHVKLIVLTVVLLAGSVATAATRTVCSGGCDFGSIQAAVDAADEGDVIQLGSETFSESSITIAKALTVQGVGPEGTVVDGGGGFYVFQLAGDVTLSGMTIQNANYGVNGRSFGTPGCPYVPPFLPVPSSHRPVLHGCVIRNCLTGVSLSAVITETTIENNQVGVDNRSGTVTIDRSTIRDNELGVYTHTPFDFDCFDDPWYPYCDCYVNPDCAFTWTFNSTFTGNTAAIGASESLYYCPANLAATIVEQSTIANNELPVPTYFEGWLGLTGSILAGYSQGCGISASGGFNLFDGGCEVAEPTDTTHTDPLLLPLAYDGGPTATHALGPDSPAIDAGGADCSATDQRGVARPQDGDGDGVAKCDIGSYEVGVLSVQIDIKPDGFPNSINPDSRGVIPVVVFGNDTLDMADVDVTTLEFGPDRSTPAHHLTDSFTYNDHLEDVNLDGFMDLVAHFRTGQTGISCGDEAAALMGKTTSRQVFAGSDSIRTIGCRADSRWGVICDPTGIDDRCDVPEPHCGTPHIRVASVVNGCWGECVQYSDCRSIQCASEPGICSQIDLNLYCNQETGYCEPQPFDCDPSHIIDDFTPCPSCPGGTVNSVSFGACGDCVYPQYCGSGNGDDGCPNPDGLGGCE